ncbi:sulfite exporter TauE/SafE family protein [Diaminobutyricimonas aerilata]|nr:sulfite exporter TauE/SafE family protein [Diaminobutyricimonas aerilata]
MRRRRSGSATPIVLLGIGAVAGVFAGTFGVGGGILMVPLLLAFAGMDQRRASATSLLAIVPTSLVGCVGYLFGEGVDVLAAALVTPGAIAGALLGTALLRRLPLRVLTWAFVAVLLLVALRTALLVPERGADVEYDALTIGGLVLLGLVMGVASGLFGIGGGAIAVPAFVAVFGMSDLLAKGTSLLVMLPTALSGSVRNVRAALVDWRAGSIVGVAATLASLPGVAIAHLLPPRVASILFALLLVASAAQLAVRELRRR